MVIVGEDGGGGQDGVGRAGVDVDGEELDVGGRGCEEEGGRVAAGVNRRFEGGDRDVDEEMMGGKGSLLLAVAEDVSVEDEVFPRRDCLEEQGCH